MRARSLRAVSSALHLARWTNALTSAAGVLVGAWWAGWGDTSTIGSAAIAAIGLTAAANAWNDVADVAIDRVAHPERPIATGALSARAAEDIAMASAVVAVWCASEVSVVLGICTVAVLLLMRLYSPWIKRSGIPGNVLVALLASLPFLYGSYAAGEWTRGIPLVIVAIPLHLARELAKDLDDLDGDAGARRTVPVIAGPRIARASMLAALLAFGVALALVLAPRMRSAALMLVALAPALIAIALAAARALRGRPGSPAFLKLAMVCAMAALLVARA